MIYCYISLLILQLTLFNLIFFGIEMIYLKKLYNFLHAFEEKQDINYRYGPLKKFIEKENGNLNSKKYIIGLIPEEEGK